MKDGEWRIDGGGDVQSEIWNLKYVVVVGVLLVSLVACLPATSAPPTLVPPSTATPSPTFTPALPSASTPTPSPTSMPTSSPTSTPTLALTPAPTFTPIPTPDVAIVRGPYLQSVTTNTIIVAWETDLPSHGAVAYGETEYGASVADATMGTRHAVTLTGLAPYTTYHYRVESSGVPLSGDGYETTFRTAAALDQDSFTFAVFGDTRTQHQFHQAVVERIVKAEPDFVLHTGDLVAMGSASPQWETFFEIERELMARAPLFPALGNHEVNHPRYFDLFYLPGNERWYTFDYGNARFVCLQVDGIADFGPQSEQYAWLEEVLAANTQPWLFVYFHVPPYSSVYDYLENDVRRVLPPLFERYGVDVVFNGHRHNYERNEVNGITYVVTGGGGAPLYAMQEREPTQVAFALAYHLVRLEVNGDHLGATVISSDGELLDEFERSAD
ncbi:MAG: metallophosphoesterase family protein [Chloroflexota bacterium]|nr:metallophosphoesterase family protein [Chloroflexota bacterium]